MIKDEQIQSIYKEEKFVGFFKKDQKSGINILYTPVEARTQDISELFGNKDQV